MPSAVSRDRFCVGITDDDGHLYLTDPEPFRYRDLPDNVQHTVTEGETWESLAFREYGDARLWWVIPDYQPEPVQDPTIALVGGAVLILPSARVVQEEILSEERREAHLA
jgi:hypothetical protein